jgi:hypothetical protein
MLNQSEQQANTMPDIVTVPVVTFARATARSILAYRVAMFAPDLPQNSRSFRFAQRFILPEQL